MPKRLYLWLFASVVIPLLLQGMASASAQIRDIDSLRTVLRQPALHDTTRALTLLQLARRLYSQNAVEMERTAREALSIAERSGFQRGIADGLLQIGRSMHVRSRYAESMDYTLQARQISEEIRDTAGIASAFHASANTYLDQANYDEALRSYLLALAMREKLNDRRGMSTTLNNLGILYKQQGKLEQALHYYEQALVINEQDGVASGTASALNNIGLLYQQQKRYEEAKNFLKRSLAIEEKIGRKQGIALSINNLGVLYGLEGKHDSAMLYLRRALAMKRENNEQQSIAQTLNETSLVQYRMRDYASAIVSASEALTIAQKINAKADIKLSAEHLAAAHKAQGDFQNALRYQELATQYRDSVFSEEKERQMSQMETKYQVSKKQVENEALRRDNTSQKRFIVLVVAACVVAVAFLAFFIYSNSQKKRINAELQEQQRLLEEQSMEIEIANSALQEANEQSERLLLNIFPTAIAERLRAGETKIAERFENVSVLFADIAGFTPLAQKLEPVVLVAVLDEIFSAFDVIAERFGLEKIKTIGDSYMLVAGVPNPRADHAEAIAMAALAIQSQITLKGDILRQMNTKLQMRVGVHTGEVVAGVIGTKKFAYDLWGDTVNIAHRMESHGVGGKIHVSEAFVRSFDTSITDKLEITGMRRITAYPHIIEKDIHNQEPLPPFVSDEMRPFIFEERGTIEVKGKGLMTTYFLLS
jgi:class 3 adenylate cyclase/tetratricopeptide (TPR) repeat protein